MSAEPISEVPKMSIEDNVISEEEIAKHNNEKDCYISIHGLVLKLDQQLFNEHPGGSETVLARAGKDVTEEFRRHRSLCHSDAAREWADKYVIGVTENYTEVKKNDKKKIPRTRELEGDKPTTGVFPIIIAVFLAIAAYLYMQQ